MKKGKKVWEEGELDIPNSKDKYQNLSGEKPERNVAWITFRVLGSKPFGRKTRKERGMDYLSGLRFNTTSSTTTANNTKSSTTQNPTSTSTSNTNNVKQAKKYFVPNMRIENDATKQQIVVPPTNPPKPK